jgi:hypothetical protein
LGIEVGVEAEEKAIQNQMKEVGFVDRIAKRRAGIRQHTAEKRVERAEGQLKSHPTYYIAK